MFETWDSLLRTVVGLASVCVLTAIMLVVIAIIISTINDSNVLREVRLHEAKAREFEAQKEAALAINGNGKPLVHRRVEAAMREEQ